MRYSRNVLIVVLAAGLILGTVSAVFAAGPPDTSPGSGNQFQGESRGFFGNVTDASETNIVVVTKQGWTVELTLADTTRYMVPALSRERVRFGTLVDYLGGDITALEGRTVAVSAFDVVEESTGVFQGEARHIIVIPDPRVRVRLHAHHPGKVTEFVAGASITIIDTYGRTRTYAVDEATVYHPSGTLPEDIADGSFVTVVTLDGSIADGTAKAIVLHHTTPKNWPPPVA